MEITFTGSIVEFDSLFRTSTADGQAEILTRLADLKELLMTTGADVKVSVDQLNQHTNDLAAGFSKAWDYAKAVKAEQDAKIADLQQKLADGQALVAADLADFALIGNGLASADAVVTSVVSQLNSIGATPTDPLPTPTPLPPVEEPPVEQVPA